MPRRIDAVMPILTEVETNWDIHVALNKESAYVPAEWFCGYSATTGVTRQHPSGRNRKIHAVTK